MWLWGCNAAEQINLRLADAGLTNLISGCKLALLSA